VFDVRDLDKDLELCKNATSKPWMVGYSDGSGRDVKEHYKGACITANDEGVVFGGQSFGSCYGVMRAEDAAFIAESREALPYWLGEVKRLREALGGEEVADWAVEAVGCRKEASKANLEIIKLRAENQRLKEALNAINNLAIKCEREDPDSMSLLPEEGK